MSGGGDAKLLHERSAGAVVFYLEYSKILYLVLLYGAGHWDFPKGNIEAGEKETDTVMREILEETGISNVEILDGFRHEINYFYRKHGNLVSKRVVFYLARSFEKNVTLSSEHKDYAWLSYDEAMDRITFRTAKDTLKKAHEFLMHVLGSSL